MFEQNKINTWYGVDTPYLIAKLVGQGFFYLVCAWILHWWLKSSSPLSASLAFWLMVMVGLALILTAFLMVGSSILGKPAVIREMVNQLFLKESERVLDVGCGTGMLLIEVAKRLPQGYVDGLDIWQARDQQPNSYEMTLLNATREKVKQRVNLTTGDMRRMPFEDSSFDSVVSSLAIHNISDEEERKQVLREIVRVLKPEGKFSLLDFQFTEQYEAILKNFGCKNVKRSPLNFRMFPPVRIVTGIR